MEQLNFPSLEFFEKSIPSLFSMLVYNTSNLNEILSNKVEAETILNYLICHRHFESISVKIKISAKRTWGCRLKWQFPDWHRMLWQLENTYKRQWDFSHILTRSASKKYFIQLSTWINQKTLLETLSFTKP